MWKKVLTSIAALAVAFLGYCGAAFFFGGIQMVRHVWLPLLLVMTLSLLGSQWINLWLRRRTRADHPRCGHCGYNLTGHAEALESAAMVCPECGRALDPSSIVRAGQPHPASFARSQARFMLIVGLVGATCLAFSAFVMHLGGHLMEGSWTVLVVAAVLCFAFALAWHKSRRAAK